MVHLADAAIAHDVRQVTMHKVKGKVDGHGIKVVSYAISPTRQVHETNIRVEMLVREARVDVLIDPRKYLGIQHTHKPVAAFCCMLAVQQSRA